MSDDADGKLRVTGSNRPVPPYIFNPDASDGNFAQLNKGFIGAMQPGDLLQHIDHAPPPSPFKDFIDQGQLSISRSPVVRILEADKGADAKPSVGLLIGHDADKHKPNHVETIQVQGLGDGYDFEKASSDQLLYALMIKAVKQLKLPQPQRIYPVEIQGASESAHYLKFATIPDALAFRQAASDGRLGNLMKEGLQEFHTMFAELKAAIDVDLESLVQASMRAENFENQETGSVRYRVFRPYANQQKAKTQMKGDWNRKNAEPEEILALKICQMNHIDGVDIQHAQASRTDAKGKETEIEYGVAYHFNTLEDVQQFACAVREPLTIKAAMEAVRDDLKRDLGKVPDNFVDTDGLASLRGKLAQAGAGHAIH